MPSVLNVDTIVDAAGTGPVTLTKQSAAKAWVVYDQSANAVRNSFNASSIADTATGDFLRNHTSSFSDAYYTNSTGGSYDGSDVVGDDSLGHRHATRRRIRPLCLRVSVAGLERPTPFWSLPAHPSSCTPLHTDARFLRCP